MNALDKILIISAVDDIVVALTDINKGDTPLLNDFPLKVAENIPFKHIIVLKPFKKGDSKYIAKPEIRNFEWNAEELFPFLATVSDAFGENKLMPGSDWSVCFTAGKNENTINISGQFYQVKDEFILDKLPGKNAAEFYTL